MLKAALIGLGKMGISHWSMINAHPDIDLVAVCDAADYMLGPIKNFVSIKTYNDYRRMLAEEPLDMVFIATPSRHHAAMVRAALDANVAVFCEKPFCLDPEEGLELAELAEAKGLTNQVGYHYRFVAAFAETQRLISLGAIGDVHHIRAEAYGPVVLRPKGMTWRNTKSEGGGCLYDYACHAIDLMNFLVGPPETVAGVHLGKVFSRDVEDEVYATLAFGGGRTGQLAVNWSDPSHRKMSMVVTAWGSQGRITANRQELQVFLRDEATPPEGYNPGWTVRYTTDMTDPVWFYLRGEEYSAQIDHFVQAVKASSTTTACSFRQAVEADRVAAALVRAADTGQSTIAIGTDAAERPDPQPPGGLWQTFRSGLRPRPGAARK